MFLLDTNVVSELLRPSPEPVVEAWVGDRQATDLYFSAIGEAELRYGVAILPAGRRQTALASAIDAILREDFADRILPFDSNAARKYADIAAARKQPKKDRFQTPGRACGKLNLHCRERANGGIGTTRSGSGRGPRFPQAGG